MRLPIQPKTVKPKVNTIANTIQNRFMLVLSLGCGTPGSVPSLPVRRCRHPHGPLHASPRVHKKSGGSVMRAGGPAPMPQRFDPVAYATQERQVNAQPGEGRAWGLEYALVRELSPRGSPPDGRHASCVPILAWVTRL